MLPIKRLSILVIFFAISSNFLAQNFRLEGKITDERNKAVENANIMVLEEIQKSTTSNKNGEFVIENLTKSVIHLQISHISFQTIELEIDLKTRNFVEILLQNRDFQLGETIVKGKIADDFYTPIQFSDIYQNQIIANLGGRFATHILESVPNVNISENGGGFADNSVSIRGFHQSDISILINGIEINNPENGEIYWSNWADISGILNNIQIQKGLSYTPYPTNSVGGIINFVTQKGFGDKNFTILKSEIGDGNFIKNSVSFGNIISQNVFLKGFISKANWNGYAEQTKLDLLTYYLALGFISKNHVVELQIMGSPQKHGQRITPQTITTWKEKGLDFNSDWGFLNDKKLNLRDNQFHNPSLTLNHNWQIKPNLSLTNILYFNYGFGGGTVPPWGGFPSDENGQIDFNTIYEQNSTNIDTNYSQTLTRSENALRFTYHIHDWAVWRSAMNYKIPHFSFDFGFTATYYFAQNYSTLSNLIGGDYYIGSGNVNQNPDKMLFVGDKIDYDADSFARSISAFFHTDFIFNKLNGFAALSIGNNSFNRIDYFNYLNSDPNRETGWKDFTTYSAKIGLNFQMNSQNNLFVNLGQFSKAPLSMNVYNYTNQLYSDIKNESVFSAEIGHRVVNNEFSFNSNLYYTLRKDKAFSYLYFNPNDFTMSNMNIYGAKEVHYGIEIESNYQPIENLDIYLNASFSQNKWLNDVSAVLQPENNPTFEIFYNAKIAGLYIGNSPMQQINFGFNLKGNISKNVDFFINPNLLYKDEFYAQFDPNSRTTEENIQSWKVPMYIRFDFSTGFAFNLEGKYFSQAQIIWNIFNLLDEENIIYAVDGVNHDKNSSLVFFERKRWSNLSVIIKF